MRRRTAKFVVQMDIFDLISISCVGGAFADLSEPAEEKEDYLRRGERIISLLKEKAKQKKFTSNAFLDIFNWDIYGKYTECYGKYDYLLKTVRAKWIRPRLDECMDDKKENIVDINPLRNLLSIFTQISESFDEVSWSSYEGNVVRNHFRTKALRGKAKKLIKLTVKDVSSGTAIADMDQFLPFPSEAKVSAKVSGNQYRLRSGGKYIRTIEAGYTFADVLLAAEVKKLVDSQLAGLSAERKADNRVYDYLRCAIEDVVTKKSSNGIFRVEDRIYQSEWFETFRKETGLPCLSVSAKEELAEQDVLKGDGAFPIWLLYGSPKNLILEPTTTGLTRNNWYWNLGKNVDIRMLVEVFDLVSAEYQADKQAEEFRRALNSDYAKSYQNLKGLSGRYLKAMEHSQFNRYFGYVEFDDDCLLSENEELAFDILNEKGERIGCEELIKEFAAIADLFGWERREEVSLRFRKLGNHKAAGLYYPTLKCLCVDIRYPNSMAHEYFHMLDYENGEVSRGLGFAKVLRAYTSAFDKELYQLSSAQRAKLGGKGKYNRSYYLQPTEIFARCGEIYLMRSLGIRNALVKPGEEDNFAYPKDINLQKLIEEYFDVFLGFDRLEFLRENETEIERGVS